MSTHRAARALFTGQLGVATRGQLRMAGISASTIGRALRSDVFVEILPGVVRHAVHPLAFEGWALAAQLYCGPTAYVTGTSAGLLAGLREMPDRPIRIAVRDRFRGTAPSWLHVSRTATVRRNEILERPDGIRVARAHLMLFALARELDDRAFLRAAEDVWHLGLATPESTARYLGEHARPGWAGAERIRRWLRLTGARQRPSESGFELDVIEAITAAGLPEPQRQHPLELPDGTPARIDVAWPEVCLGVEPGHSWWHGGDEQTKRDYARDRACGRIGWHIMRFEEDARKDLASAVLEVRETYEVRHSQLRRPRSGQC